MSEIVWRTLDEARNAAAAAERPLLVRVSAEWCPRELALDVADAPEDLRKWVSTHFVTGSLDGDDPRAAEWSIDAWPSLVVLGPDGEEWARATNLDHEGTGLWLAQVLQERGVSAIDLPDARRLRPGPAVLGGALVESVARSLLEAFDRSHGGFGTGQKFPHPEALDFATLYYAKTQDAAYGELVQKSLEEMAKGRLFDAVSGGFFRYCRTRDWRSPHTEIRLETQAGLLRNYLEAASLFERPDFLKIARKILSYLEHSLDDPKSGLWFGSQDADGEYYSLDEVRRSDRKPPPVEQRCYTASVAQCVSSLLKAASVLEDRQLEQRALHGLDSLLDRCYRPGKGMYHSFDGESPQMLGMLTDQVYTARALLHAYQYTGTLRHLELAQDLLDCVLRKESPRRGGFSDFAEDDAKYATARRQSSALSDNGVAAEALLRAHRLCGRTDYRDAAERALVSFAQEHTLYGYFTATYGRAVELFLAPPLQVVVVGNAEDAATEELLATAHRTYVPTKLVMTLDPARDRELLERHGLPASSSPTAWVLLERSCVMRTGSSEKLAEAMLRGERRRSRSSSS